MRLLLVLTYLFSALASFANGTPFSDGSGTGPDVQPYKYNSKEFDVMHGLHTYDYGARQYDPLLAVWHGVDPLCEKDYRTGTSVYCRNNPLRFVDTDGKVIILAYTINGNRHELTIDRNTSIYRHQKHQFVSDFFKAYNYNTRNGGGRNLRYARNDDKHIYYVYDASDPNLVSESVTDFYTEDGKSIIRWESRMGLETTEGGFQSPATRLEHEFTHAVGNFENPSLHRRMQRESDILYDNKEERRVITGSETETAIKNQEGIRHNHNGTIYKTKSPITTEKDEEYY